MISKEILDKIKALEGISPTEWQKIKLIIDKTFNKQIGEFKQQLKLSTDDLADPF